jgi:hypothetical protein
MLKQFLTFLDTLAPGGSAAGPGAVSERDCTQLPALNADNSVEYLDID